VIFHFEKTLFHSSVFSGVLPSPFWAGALASIYGAVNEEVLLRLFLFTLFYLILTKAFKMGAHQKLLWVANIVVALVFGLAHLPAAFQVASPSVFEVVRILFLNGIAGLVFGWLYWSRGLWAAMCAHFTADLMIHVFLA
jgi:membrane protease YdiL (CAAX protease family)